MMESCQNISASQLAVYGAARAQPSQGAQYSAFVANIFPQFSKLPSSKQLNAIGEER